MKPSTRLCIVLSVMLLSATHVCLACTENVYRPGQGMAYRQVATLWPAIVLIDASPEASGFGVGRAAELQQGLVEAGHTVAVISDGSMLEGALASERYDVLITGVLGAVAFGETSLGAAGGPIVLPVIRGEPSDRGLAGERFEETLEAEASLRRALKAIERLMESRTP